MTKTAVRIVDLAGRDGVLAGALAGKAVCPRMDAIVRKAEPGALLLLDFEGVQILTSSFFVASLWAVFWQGAEAQERDIYPLIFRATGDPREEIEIALRANGSPALFATGGEDSFSVEAFNLERTAQATLDLVRKRGAATAGDLSGLDDRVGKTAWNNRLAQLHQQRILKRRKVGRQLEYSPCWEA